MTNFNRYYVTYFPKNVANYVVTDVFATTAQDAVNFVRDQLDAYKVCKVELLCDDWK